MFSHQVLKSASKFCGLHLIVSLVTARTFLVFIPVELDALVTGESDQLIQTVDKMTPWTVRT